MVLSMSYRFLIEWLWVIMKLTVMNYVCSVSRNISYSYCTKFNIYVWLIAVLMSACQLSFAQNGYSYDRPETSLGPGVGGTTPGFGAGVPGAGYPAGRPGAVTPSVGASGGGYPSTVGAGFPAGRPGPTTPGYPSQADAGMK